MTSPEIVRQIRARNYWPPGPNNALVRVALASPKNAIVVVVGAADGGGLEHLHAAGLRVRPFDILADPDDPEASVAFWPGNGPLDSVSPATADFAGGAACTRSPITAVNMATSAADALRPGGVLCFTCNTNDRNCMRGMDALAKFLRVQVLAGAFTLLKEWVEADPDDPNGSKKKVRVVRAVRTGAPLASFAAAAHSKSWSRPIYAEGHAQPLFFADTHVEGSIVKAPRVYLILAWDACNCMHAYVGATLNGVLRLDEHITSRTKGSPALRAILDEHSTHQERMDNVRTSVLFDFADMASPTKHFKLMFGTSSPSVPQLALFIHHVEALFLHALFFRSDLQPLNKVLGAFGRTVYAYAAVTGAKGGAASSAAGANGVAGTGCATGRSMASRTAKSAAVYVELRDRTSGILHTVAFRFLKASSSSRRDYWCVLAPPNPTPTTPIPTHGPLLSPTPQH